MSLIYETENFLIETLDSKPHIDRNDGGHILIVPKVRVGDRTKLTPDLAKELMKLTMITGEAMMKVMNEHGVDVGRINYQENGNWSVFKPSGSFLHEHLYGRAQSAKIQKYGEALHFPQMSTGFYDANEPLTEKDIIDIRASIEELLKTSKYIGF
jgi:diadenosine tetraphosphate (Ap4A) HIT family hydrolase